jgi:hypothetical protein
MSYTFNQYQIRDDMLGAIQRYIEHGIPPGDFLRAVICNDLAEAVGRADEENMANLPAYVAYFWNKAPSTCWGSVDKMKAWMADHRPVETHERSAT